MTSTARSTSPAGKSADTLTAPPVAPHEAYAYFTALDGNDDAWLGGTPAAPVGVLRMDPADPDSLVVFDDPSEWARMLTSRGMREAPIPTAEGKGAPPFAKDDGGGSTGKDGKNDTAPSIATGTFVSFKGGKGRVDLVVRKGTVPGVETAKGDGKRETGKGDGKGEAPTATDDQPLARVVVWEESDGTWKATRRKIAARVAALKRIPPLAGRKAVITDLDVPAALVSLHTSYLDAADVAAATGSKAHPVPNAAKVIAAYQDAVATWPGEDCGLTSADWGLACAAKYLADSTTAST